VQFQAGPRRAVIGGALFLTVCGMLAFGLILSAYPQIVACMRSASMKRIAVVVLLLAAVASVASVPPRAADAAACHAALQKITLSKTSVPGGAPVRVTVMLTCATPVALTVRLKGFKGVTVPSALHVARRKSTATGTIKTAVRTAKRHGEIRAALGQARRQAALTVTKTPRSCRTPALTGLSVPRLVYVGTARRPPSG
jgi:hypothetical protein